MITQRISKLREKMMENNVQAYIIPTSDFHETEYVCEYFACRNICLDSLEVQVS